MDDKNPSISDNAGTAPQGTRWSQTALAKAEIVQPLVALHPIPPEILSEACRKAAELLGKRHVPPGTIYRWRNEFQVGGISALEHKPHRDRSESTLHPDLRQYIEDCLKDSKNYSLAEVHRRAEKKAHALQLDVSQWPSYDQIRFIDAKLSDAVKIYGRQGRRAYRKTHEQVGRFEADYPNQIWQSDHHLLDILIINPDTDKAQRPWITGIIDDHSRAIMGYYLSFEHPNSNSIALALHHAMMPKADSRWSMHGIPEIFYVDNGKDFRSKHISEVCLHFETERRSHEPYLARSKGKIERWFRTLEEMCIKYLDGYVGSSPKDRPQHVTPTLTLDLLQAEIVSFILDTYHERIHSETKEKPRSRWQGSLKTVRTVEQQDDLDHLLESTSVKVQNDGIKFRGRYYADLAGKLSPFIGQTVRVFHNRNDHSWIRVWVPDVQGERFLCKAEANVDPRILAEQSKETRRQLSEEIMASRRRLKAANSSIKPSEVTLPLQKAQPTKNKDWAPAAVTPSQIIRYRYELEELDDDADGIEQ